MSPALEAVLAKAGLQVTPDEFLSLVADAAKKLAPPHPDPASYFPPDQRDALEDVGLDLSPHRIIDDQGRARTVVAHAVLRDSALTVAEAARQLGVDTSRIRHRLGVGRLVGWKDRLGGWDSMVNKSSTTWRQLPEHRKAPGSDAEWKLLLKEYPQLIRRPVVVTGDVGEIPDGISRVLEELALAKVPVLVIVGNRECQKEFSDGVAQAQAKL